MADVASSSASLTAEKTISLKTNDDRVFALPRKAIAVSGTINTMLRDLGGDDESDFSSEIPLPNVSGSIFEKIEEWCRHHKDDAPYVHIDPREQRTEDISPWDQDFLNVEQSTLFEILQAANYLDMKPLLDTCCKTLANIMKGKSTQELRDTFHIENDFSPEEEEQIRRENAWCED